MNIKELKAIVDTVYNLEPDAQVVRYTGRDGGDSYSEVFVRAEKIGSQQEGENICLVVS
jgi:hypothetical protein